MIEDLRVGNGIFVGQAGLSCQLSAIALLFRFMPVPQAHIDGLTRIDVTIRHACPEFEPWLFLGDYDWQPDKPLYRHTTFWYREGKNPLMPEGERIAERMIESSEGIKFFTALRCGSVDPASIDRLLSARPSFAFSYLRSRDGREIAEGLVQTGWEPCRSPALFCAAFSASACAGSMLIYSPLGAFDDADAGAALIGRPEPIEKCHSALSGAGSLEPDRLTH